MESRLIEALRKGSGDVSIIENGKPVKPEELEKMTWRDLANCNVEIAGSHVSVNVSSYLYQWELRECIIALWGCEDRCKYVKAHMFSKSFSTVEWLSEVYEFATS